MSDDKERKIFIRFYEGRDDSLLEAYNLLRHHVQSNKGGANMLMLIGYYALVSSAVGRYKEARSEAILTPMRGKNSTKIPFFLSEQELPEMYQVFSMNTRQVANGIMKYYMRLGVEDLSELLDSGEISFGTLLRRAALNRVAKTDDVINELIRHNESEMEAGPLPESVPITSNNKTTAPGEPIQTTPSSQTETDVSVEHQNGGDDFFNNLVASFSDFMEDDGDLNSDELDYGDNEEDDLPPDDWASPSDDDDDDHH